MTERRGRRRGHQQWIIPYFQMYSGRFSLYLILGILTLLTASMLMFTSGFLISKSATMPYNILLVYVPIVGVRAFGIGRAAIHYVERLVGHDAVLRILSKMRVRLYRIVEPQALFIRSRYRTGDILGALADDIEQLQNVYIRTVFPSLVAVVLYAAAVIALGTFDAVFAILVAAYIFVLVAVLPYISLKLTQKLDAEVKQERNGLYQKLTDAVMGIGDWVISGRSDDFLHEYERDEAAVMHKEWKLRTWARWRMLISQLMVGIAVCTMIWWSGGQAASGQIDPTLIAAFVLVVIPLSDAFLPVSEAVQRLPEYRESLNRLERMEGGGAAGGAGGSGVGGVGAGSGAGSDANGTSGGVSGTGSDANGTCGDVSGTGSDANGTSGGVSGTGNGANGMCGNVSGTGSDARDVAGNTGGGAFGPAPGSVPAEAVDAAAVSAHLRLEQVRFSYAVGGEASVDGVTLDIPQGKRVMIIGRSGAGKSTLLKLIQGVLAPTGGTVTINGLPSAAYSGDDGIPRIISVLNQSPHLFDTTVANNIRLGNPDAEMEDIAAAAERAQLGGLLAGLPQGIHTPMRETGQRFSGGERQRVALARVLLQNTPVLVLDEPTVGLDPRTERDLLSTVFKSTAGKTLVWVTHHLAFAEEMDEIVFMEHGRILMCGTHAELMEREPRYRNLYRLDHPEAH